MKKFAQLAVAAGAALALAACGDADDVSDDAEAETVELPAEEALSDVEEEPVAAPVTETAPAPTDPATSDEALESAAMGAEQAAAAARAAAAAAEIETE